MIHIHISINGNKKLKKLIKACVLPKQEQDEGPRDLVEHGDVDVANGQPWMPAHHGDQLGPGQDNDDG